MAITKLVYTDISWDAVNDGSEQLMSAGRKLVELQVALTEAKECLAQTLVTRVTYTQGTISQLMLEPAIQF